MAAFFGEVFIEEELRFFVAIPDFVERLSLDSILIRALRTIIVD